jgi:hypothetical protein
MTDFIAEGYSMVRLFKKGPKKKQTIFMHHHIFLSIYHLLLDKQLANIQDVPDD